MKNRPQNIILHHSAVSREKNNNQFDAINRYHKGKGWGMIGYQYLIEPSGVVKTGRSELAVGAHCKEKMMNYRSIGICLTGNFDVEEPTVMQLESLGILLKDIQERYNIPDANIYPHRHFATYKSCWGKNLSDDVLGTIERSKGGTVSKWAEKSVQKATDKKIAMDWTNPQEVIGTSTLKYILKNLGWISSLEGEITKERFIVALDKAKLL